MKMFLSYNFADEPFVQRVHYYLLKQAGLTPYCYAGERHVQNFAEEIGNHILDSEAFLLFLGKVVGATQEKEALIAINNSLPGYVVNLPGAAPLPKALGMFSAVRTIDVPALDESRARECAKEVTKSLLGVWIPDDDLPIGYPFDYEKRIIKEYAAGELSADLIAQGCPKEWPTVQRNRADTPNYVGAHELGLFRDWDTDTNTRKAEEPRVLAAALTDLRPDVLTSKGLAFPEAGPRTDLRYPNRNNRLTVGVLVSGGIAPGINAVIAGIVERQFLYASKGHFERGMTVLGYQDGFASLCFPGIQFRPLDPEKIDGLSSVAGSFLGTSRTLELIDSDPARKRRVLEDCVNSLSGNGVEILYIIGGDGSMKAAHALWRTAQDLGRELSVVAVPKTIDNDVLWVWQSFGFLSAVAKSDEVIQQLYTEAKSNPRLCVIQLFGSDSGFVVTHAVSASGVCDLFLVPEVPFTLRNISSYMAEKLKRRFLTEKPQRAYGMVVMAETAVPEDARDYFNDPEVDLSENEKKEIQSYLTAKRVFGPTPDALRSGALKLVSRVLQNEIRKTAGDYWNTFRVFTNEPRHLIRSAPPSSSDIIFGKRLGSLAVDCAMAGYTDFMISQWLTEYVMVPLRLVTLGRKRISMDGIFYKSARASTGQPADLK